MSEPAVLNLTVPQGKTWSEVLRWAQPDVAFRAFASSGAIVQLAPLRIKTEVAHDMPDGWSCRITNVVGMVQLNDRDFVVKKISDDTVEISEIIDSVDDNGRPCKIIRQLNAAGYSAYVSGGYLEYHLPVDLAGMTMAWQGRKAFDATAKEFDFSTTLSANGSGLVLDNVLKTVTLQVAALDSAPWIFDQIVHEIEVTDAAGKKPPFAAGRFELSREVVK